jgi:GNAT superfamily N-acetyltransferase
MKPSRLSAVAARGLAALSRPSRDLLRAAALVHCDIFTFKDGLVTSKDAFRKALPVPRSPCPTTAAGIDEESFSVRHAHPADSAALLPMMRELARFEGYLDRFTPTVADLQARMGTPESRGEFEAVVAQSRFLELWGYCAFHSISFTYDLRPTLVVKELFVVESARSIGVGAALFKAVVKHAAERGCGRIKWDVLPTNEPAKAFYAKLGGRRELDWEAWKLEFPP